MLPLHQRTSDHNYVASVRAQHDDTYHVVILRITCHRGVGTVTAL